MPLIFLLLFLSLASPAHAQRFAIIGDYGYDGPDLAAVADLVHSWNVDFVITTGDNNYDFGEAATIDENIGKYFSRYIHPYRGAYGQGAEVNRFFPSLGNHDWIAISCFGDRCRGPYLDYFEVPGNERYYDVVWDSVHLFAIDSDTREPHGTSSESAQARWLRDGLEASASPWKVVYMHHAPYSSGSHGSAEYLRWPFEEWGADVVLSGHDHVYERLSVEEFPYIVNGLGGRSRSVFRDEPLPFSAVRYRDQYGAMMAEADDSELSLAFITVLGDTVDQYRLFADEDMQRDSAPERPSKLEVFPQPARDVVQVVLTARTAPRTLQLIDVLGRIVWQETISPGPPAQVPVDVSGFSAGVYFVRVMGDAGTSTATIVVSGAAALAD